MFIPRQFLRIKHVVNVIPKLLQIAHALNPKIRDHGFINFLRNDIIHLNRENNLLSGQLRVFVIIRESQIQIDGFPGHNANQPVFKTADEPVGPYRKEISFRGTAFKGYAVFFPFKINIRRISDCYSLIHHTLFSRESFTVLLIHGRFQFLIRHLNFLFADAKSLIISHCNILLAVDVLKQNTLCIFHLAITCIRLSFRCLHLRGLLTALPRVRTASCATCETPRKQKPSQTKGADFRDHFQNCFLFHFP